MSKLLKKIIIVHFGKNLIFRYYFNPKIFCTIHEGDVERAYCKCYSSGGKKMPLDIITKKKDRMIGGMWGTRNDTRLLYCGVIIPGNEAGDYSESHRFIKVRELHYNWVYQIRFCIPFENNDPLVMLQSKLSLFSLNLQYG